MGVRLASPADRAEADRARRARPTAPRRAEFAAAWAAGQRMTLAEAVTYALEPGAERAHRRAPAGADGRG